MMSKIILLCCFIALTFAASSRRTIRIAGGAGVKPGQVPYYVSLYYKSSLSVRPISFCGGAILNEQWILTGAACIMNPNEIAVKAGSIYYTKPTETQQLSDVDLAIAHPKYKEALGPFDIGLLKLKTPLKFNKFVSSIDLAPAETIPSGSGKIMGLGSTASIAGLIFPEILQMVSLPIIKNDECARLVEHILGSDIDVTLTDEWRFCAGPTEANQGHCLQDTGSPFTSEINGKDVLVGVANFGFAADCTTPNAPSIYTRVSSFNSWIAHTIKAN